MESLRTGQDAEETMNTFRTDTNPGDQLESVPLENLSKRTARYRAERNKYRAKVKELQTYVI